MFVASLNLDLFFKKVFSSKRVAKKFLEDLLGVKITEIKLLSVENKLTDYVFQKNIVKNKRVDLPYFKWFDVANISRNPSNKEEDFSKYKSDKEMSEVISRIRKDKLSPDEFKYVSDLYTYDIHMARMAEDFKEKLARKAAAQEKRFAKAEQKAEQLERKAEQFEQKAEQFEQKAELSENRLLKSIKMLLQQGETVPSISEALDISLEEITELVARIQNN